MNETHLLEMAHGFREHYLEPCPNSCGSFQETVDKETMKAMPGAILQAMRPRQWIKNASLLVALVFSRQLFSPVARTIHIRNGVIIAEFDDRKPDQPMAVAPSIAETIYLELNEGCLTAIKPPVR